jgi:hypothetical protein
LFGFSQSVLLSIPQLAHLRIQSFNLRLQAAHRRHQRFYVGSQLRRYRSWSSRDVLTSARKRQKNKERGDCDGVEVELEAPVRLHDDPLKQR